MFQSVRPYQARMAAPHRPNSPPSRPEDLPPPTNEELDFIDPPGFINNTYTKTFWCISTKVRNHIMKNRPKPVFFCFHRGFCQFQVKGKLQTQYESNLLQTHPDASIAKEMIENHLKKKPHHRMTPQVRICHICSIRPVLLFLLSCGTQIIGFEAATKVKAVLKAFQPLLKERDTI